MADLTKLSDDDLMALKSGDLAKVSDAGLMALKGAPAPNKAKEFGKKYGDARERGVLSALQGPTFGFIDEIAGGIGGVTGMLQGKPFGESYRETRDVVRGMNEKYKDDFPIGAPATQVMTSMATAPLFKAKAAAGLLPSTLQATGTGAASGALSGLGESTAEDLTGMATDTLKSGVAGGAMGSLGNLGMAAVGAGGRNVVQRVAGADKLPVLLGGSGVLNAAKRSADKEAQAKIVEALVRDSNVPGSAVSQALAHKVTLGPEARMVDAGGQNTRQLLDTMATLPGRTKQTVEQAIRERQAGRAGRLMGSAEGALKTGGRKFTETIDELTRVRSQNAGPLYKALDGVNVTIDDDAAKLLARAGGLDAEARKLYRAQTGQDVGSLAELKTGDSVPFSLLDTLKQTLYDAASSAKREGKNKMGAAWDDVRVQLTDKLDDMSPKMDGASVYKLARDEFAGKSQLIDAAETGRKAIRGDLFDLKDAMRGMGKSEIDAFRIGAVESLREKTGRQAGQTELLNMWKEPATRERLQAVFGKDYRQFAAAVAGEARLKGMEGIGRGSQTTSRLYGIGDMDMSPISDAATMAASVSHGNIPGMLTSGMNLMRSVKTPEPVRDRMGALLLSRDPNELRALGPLLDQVNSARASKAAAMGLLGGQAGSGMIGGLLSQ